MSGEATLWAARQDITNHAAKLTLVALCDAFDDRTGLCFPSHEHICEFVRRSETQIKEAIRWLEAEGWIKRENRFCENGRQKANNYKIVFDRGESFNAMLERRRKMKGSNDSSGKSTGGGKAPGVGTENRPLEGAEKRHPLTESLLNTDAQAREIDKSTGKGQKETGAQPSDEAEGANWRNRLIMYRKRGIWPPKWGPAMHQPGCKIPAHLVAEWDEHSGKTFVEAKAAAKQPSEKAGWTRRGNGFAAVGEAARRLNLPGTSHD